MALRLIAGVLLTGALLSAAAANPVWIGIGFISEKNVPEIGGVKPELGFRVNALPYLSPAETAGVHVGDIIVAMDGRGFHGEPASAELDFRDSILRHIVGDQVTLRIVRDKVIDITVKVEERPVGVGGVKEYTSTEQVERTFPKAILPEEQFANSLIDEFKIREGYADLRDHLAHLSDRGDPFRLSLVAYIQHEPFQLRTVAGKTLDQLASAVVQRNPAAAVNLAAEWLDAPVGVPPPLKIGLTLEQHLDQLVALLGEAAKMRNAAFAGLSAEDRKYLEENCGALFTAFSNDIGLPAEHIRTLELAARVDFKKLFEGAALMARVTDDKYLDDLEAALRKAWEAAGRPDDIFISRDSPVGKILVGGQGHTWYTDDAAIVLDLGGKDFYTNNAGAARGEKMPASLLIDFAGDDAYEATFNWTQGAALMGYGVLIDRKGNDEYVSPEWAQGAAVLGAGLFLDEAGDDVYRADQYAQGVAAWGIGLHVDYTGDDTYESHLLSQGVAMAGGAGWLLNGTGNDHYYSKGKHPTNYGDPGIFDSWSQASSIGFRGLQSGGVAVLYDGAGKDRYEAGNFSQGGGYYFGIGMLRDAGADDDSYIGSRYNQAFAAHQAIGYFEEAGGNDYYTARHAVAQGTSWDETITAFIDRAGDDIYEGGASFSQGASAHNGFSLFLDLGGKNRFVYAGAQGTAGPNDYHGGKSFSLFIAAEDKGNTYTSKMKPGGRQLNGDYGIFVDMKEGLPKK